MALQSNSSYIDILNKITCRIQTPHDKGTAVLLNLPQQDTLYLLTAKHCLLGKQFDQEIHISDVQLFVPNTDQELQEFKLDEPDQILMPSAKDIDAAVIVLRKQRDLQIPQIKLLNTQYTEKDCFFRGYPQAYGLLQGITIRPVNYVEHNIVTTTTPLSTLDSDPLHNCQGFSGSGVFCEVNGQLFLTSLIYELGEAFRRFSVCDLSFLNKLLSSHGLPVIRFGTLPLNESISKDIQKLTRKTTLLLDGIKHQLGRDFFLKRNSVESDFESQFSANRLLIFKGIAGAGKSAYAKSIVLSLRDSNYSILAFKADLFAKESIEESFSYLENSFYDIFNQLGQQQQTVVLIDSLEKLLEVETYEALKEFLRICQEFNGITIIVTCRSFAYQQLLLELHYDFPKYYFVDIPPFSDQELAKVEKRFPYLAEPLQNHSLKQILRSPFYLNLVLLHSELFKIQDTISEREIRKLIWDRVITKRKPKRGYTFENIALQRAISMSLYVRIEHADPLTIRQLYNDDLILIEENLGEAYSPSHDIYEDIALIRVVERAFQKKASMSDFFKELGEKGTAMRRAFRLWLNDQLVDVSANLTAFISEVLAEVEIQQYWKDETIISILRSKYCQNFFDANEELLVMNEHALLQRFIHILRTTCQEPDEQLIQTLKKTNQGNRYQWIYLRPVGPGWEVLLNYIHDHLDDLYDHRRLILQLIIKDWSKGLSSKTEFPSEAKAAAKILLEILEEAKNYYLSWNEKVYSKEDIDEAIRVLFNLGSIFKDGICCLIEKAHAYHTERAEINRLRALLTEHPRFLYFKADNLYSEEEKKMIEKINAYDAKSKNYYLRDFYTSVITHTLSGLYSQAVCRELPDFVCDVALSNWLQYNSYKYYDPDPFNSGQDFGLAKESRSPYFPAGIYKTPIRFLLYSHPSKALNLIVAVLNHATDAYAKSERGESSHIIEVEIHRENGEVTTQRGNRVLWGMYRGLGEVTPYLLQSILMSLEAWLLELCQIKDQLANTLLEYTYTYLLKNSSTVATTSVLASVALAYPSRVNKLCFPILKVKEFYSWDIERMVGDLAPFAVSDSHIPFAQEERHKSNQLPHRKLMLEGLVTKLQVEGYWNQINDILDDFQSKAKQEDKLWKLALSRMDIRKYEVDDSIRALEKNVILIKPRIDKELSKIVEENQKNQKLANKAIRITTWAEEVYQDQGSTENLLEKWREQFLNYQKISDIENECAKLFADPTYLATIGIRDLHRQLTQEEVNLCVGIILAVLIERIIGNIKQSHYSKNAILPVLQSVPSILSLQLDHETKEEAKEAIFLSLLHLVTHQMEYPFESIRDKLWTIDKEFAHSCFAGMLEYAKLRKQRRYYPRQSAKSEKQLQEFFREEGELAIRVCNNKIELDIANLSFETHSHWYLGFAAQIIPFDTLHNIHTFFIKNIFQLLFQLLDENGKDWQHDITEFLDTIRDFKQYLARFLLSQPKQPSKALFSEILDHIFVEGEENVSYKAREFIQEIVDAIIMTEYQLKSPRFWDLWEVLESKIRTSKNQHCISYLFLSHRWWNSDAEDWSPLKNKKLYFRKLITELGHYDIGSVIKLLAGIGSKRLLPDGLIWLKIALDNCPEPLQELKNSNTFSYAEKLIRRVYYRYLKDIKGNRELRDSFLYLLDKMVNLGSSLAFMVRERVISIG